MKFNAEKNETSREQVSALSANYNLSASISNEFRVLVNEILSLDSMLLKECDKPELKALANDVQTASRNILSLLNDVVDFSKLESGEMSVVPVKYSLFLSLNECFELFATRVRDKQLDFNFKVDPNLPVELYGDEKRIRQIITTLLFYSIKYTRQGGVTLNVSYERVANGPRDSINLMIAVKDTGDGIPDIAMQNLFNISDRIARQQDIESVDLGLNLAKRLVDLLHGTIHVESGFGRGTTFSISIPQVVKKEDVMGDFFVRRKNYYSSIEGVVNSFCAPDVDILVADELPMNHRVIKDLLRASKIRVDSASNGMEALEKIKRKHYHVIFVDRDLPVMNAEETMDIMKTLSGNPNEETPMVLLVSDGAVSLPESYRKQGFANCLQKPVREDSLLAVLEELIPVDLVKTVVQVPSPSKVLQNSEKKNEKESPDVSADVPALMTLAKDPKVPSDLLNLSATGFVDIKVGLELCQNDEDLYREQLESFVKLSHEKSLEAAFENEDMELYRLEIRALKSSALGIGAIDLASHAKAMEYSCKDGHYDYTQMNHSHFMREYRNLLNILNDIIL